LGKEEYAVDISYAQEIIRIPEFTKLPNVPSFIEGIINLRGKVIPVFDLKKRFDIDQTERGSDSRLLILEMDGMTAGIIVDDVSEVMRADDESFQNLSSEVVSISKNSIDRIVIVGQRVIIILNAIKLKEEISIFKS
jgi:purine-binding chemotaxis protein CheW